jgi:hypothetical protein
LTAHGTRKRVAENRKSGQQVVAGGSTPPRWAHVEDEANRGGGCELCAAGGRVDGAGCPRRGQAKQRLSARIQLGPVTVEEALALPRSQAAVNAGLITEEDLGSVFEGFDRNQSGTICIH